PRLPATLSLVGAGLGVSIVPGSMRRLGGDGIVYRTLAEEAQLSAPLYLALRRSPTSPIVERFRQLVLETVGQS
ncbi:LysR family transcriptional regulator, partial [Serratia marcescens]